MIKFFRKIRQNLLSEGKTGKYLKYAIGEIILVVIGILIALSINNWNKNRVERHKEKLILSELIVDLKEQSKVLETYIEIESRYYQHGKDILSFYSSNQTFIGSDSIYAKLNSLMERKTFNPIRTTFQELIATGTIGILQDKSTKRKIIQYYNDLERVSMVIGNNNIHIVDAIYQTTILEQILFVWDSNDADFNKLNNTIFDEKSLKKVREISSETISKRENTLLIFNILEQRTHIAKLHLESYKTLKSDTEKLLSELKTQNNEQ
jgi:hypothetical protein